MTEGAPTLSREAARLTEKLDQLIQFADQHEHPADDAGAQTPIELTLKSGVVSCFGIVSRLRF